MLKKLYKKLLSEKHRNSIRISSYKLRHLKYIGKERFCVCCSTFSSTFLPKGYTQRPNAECPRCGSLERHRLLDLFLTATTDVFKKPCAILHIAPEGTLKKKLSKIASPYIDGDINSQYASHVVDLTAIQFENNTFDYIICSHVLGHIQNEAKAVNEMYRVIKPGGKAFVLTLIDKKNPVTYENPTVCTAAEKLKHYGEPDLCRLHGRDFAKRLAAPGFEVITNEYYNHFDNQKRELYGLGNGDREIIFECIKPKD